MRRRRHLSSWFAILLAVWLTLTGFVAVMIWTFSPGLGPHADVETSRHAAQNVFLWLPVAVWFAVPLVLAPFGLRAADPE